MASAGTPLLEAVRWAVAERGTPLGRRGLEIRLGVHGAEAGVLGIAALLLERLLSPAGLERLYEVARPRAEVEVRALRVARSATRGAEGPVVHGG